LRSLSSLYKLRSESAVVIRKKGVKERVPTEQLKIGDLISVASGEGIPTDGIVIDGVADMEESLLTGESQLVIKRTGDRVFAGTNVVSGQLVVQADSRPSDTLLSRMISFVEEAQRSKPRIQRRVDLIAAFFVPIIIVLALVTYFVWVKLSNSTEAFEAAMAVLLVACPCALGLATPVSILIGSSIAARSGLIFKAGSMFETLSRTNVFVFDKTGTLTEGKPRVAEIRSERLSELKILKLAASLEQHSNHPFARAIVKEAQAKGLVLSPVMELKEYPGNGIVGVVDDCRLIIGHSHWLDELGYNVTEEELKDSKLHIVLENRLSGSITFRDPLREEAQATLSSLEKEAQLWLATGDGESAAKSVAAQTGIANVKFRMLPEEKFELVRQLQKQGKSVAMVGDGVNDIAALSVANIGIAMAGSNDAALQAGDVVIVGGRLTGVRDAFEIANRTMRNIRQNLGIALLYNAVMIPLAALGMLDPRTACISMASSSILVVGNALRLQRIPIARSGWD
jgi:P-type Cu+ transporter